MSAKDTIKSELQNLTVEGRTLPLLIKDDIVMEFGSKYQAWYTKTLKVITVLAPDRLEEFFVATTFLILKEKQLMYPHTKYKITLEVFHLLMIAGITLVLHKSWLLISCIY